MPPLKYYRNTPKTGNTDHFYRFTIRFTINAGTLTIKLNITINTINRLLECHTESYFHYSTAFTNITVSVTTPCLSQRRNAYFISGEENNCIAMKFVVSSVKNNYL